MSVESSSLSFATLPSNRVFSAEDYAEHCWPQLESAIRRMLSVRSGQHSTVSFEQQYSRVYTCVCQHMSDRLYSDLGSLIADHLNCVLQHLEEQQTEIDFLVQFNEASSQYRRAAEQISLIFTYLDKFYTQPKLRTTLLKVLMLEFRKRVSDNCLDRLLSVMTSAMSSPFTVPPAVISGVVNELHTLKPEYSLSAPALFSLYIPNLLPAMGPDDIATHVTEVHMIQERLIREGFSRNCSPLKRTLECE